MKLKDVMTKGVIAVDKDERLETVLESMRKNRVSKLVVTERGRIVGLVTDGDIADELGAIKNRGVPTSQLHASSAMRRSFPTASPDASVAEALRLMGDDGAGILPVVHDGTALGCVTNSDLLKLVDSDERLEKVMTPRVHVVSSTDRVIHARRVMLDHHVERLPVIDGGKLVGIVGESDLAFGFAKFKATVADAHQGSAIQRFLVEDVMQRQVVTSTPETTVREAAKTMLEMDVGCLPVLRGERLMGIVTRSDLRRFVKA